MKKEYIILMADIVRSSEADQAELMRDFSKLVRVVNKSRNMSILSPLTITLGDEFQGIIRGLVEAINIIQELEESLLDRGKIFKLRYVVVEGEVDTPINQEIAYGMLGEGLTRARKQVENLKKSHHRFHFDLKDNIKAEALNHLYIAIQVIIDAWKPDQDYKLVSTFLKNEDYKEVALALNKDRSLMWRRNRTLKIDAYQALKEVAIYIGGNTHD